MAVAISAAALLPVLGLLLLVVCSSVMWATGSFLSGRLPLPPDSFVTLSIWTDWASIEASTGAGTRAPGATRHAERLAELDVAHYEVVPR